MAQPGGTNVLQAISALAPQASYASIYAKPEGVEYVRFVLTGTHVGIKIMELADSPIGHLVVSGFRAGM